MVWGKSQLAPVLVRNSLLHLVSPATEKKSLGALLCNPPSQVTMGWSGILKTDMCYLQASSRYVPEQKRALRQVQWSGPRALQILGAGGGIAAWSPGAPEESSVSAARNNLT